MKYILTSLIIMILFSSCATKSAFSKFDMDEKQELSASSLQSSKISSKDGVDGVVSAIYLNEIYPEEFNEYESFYVYLYLKRGRPDFTIKLNGELPLNIEKLPYDNKFAHLVSTDNDWNKYYLVTFGKDDSNSTKLNIVVESGESSSAVLNFKNEK